MEYAEEDSQHLLAEFQEKLDAQGDTVRYPDGREARITSGAGSVSVYKRRSMALVGSALDNDDMIDGPIHEGMAVLQREGLAIADLFDPGYIPYQSNGIAP